MRFEILPQFSGCKNFPEHSMNKPLGLYNFNEQLDYFVELNYPEGIFLPCNMKLSPQLN